MLLKCYSNEIRVEILLDLSLLKNLKIQKVTKLVVFLGICIICVIIL